MRPRRGITVSRPGAPETTRPDAAVLALRPRRGAFLAIVGMLFIGLVAVSAMSIDMSRLGILRAELQISADAGAHAGMVEYLMMLPGPISADRMRDSARAYAQKNTALQVVPTIDETEVGNWNGATFTPGGSPTNAVNVQVSVQSVGLFMEMVGVSSPVVHATAIAWTTNFSSPPATCGIPAGPGFRQCPVLVR